MSNLDSMQRFTFDKTDVRGQLVGLHKSLSAVLSKHDYPAVLKVELGKLMAASALMSATLKYEGRLCLQVRLPGDVSLIQAETTNTGEIRAIARYDEDKTIDTVELIGGQLVITLEPAVGKSYQGIVPLESNQLNEAFEYYFKQSEQLGSRFWLECDGTIASGFMLQQLPAVEGYDVDAWDRLSHLASTLKDEELLTLNNETILHRLYHDEEVRLYDEEDLRFACTCSKERIGNAIAQMGLEELMEVIVEQGKVSVDCQFCLQHYSFNKEQVGDLFPEKKLQ
ncbi:MAG: Hsp33 family molecular chaperone HslO [Oleispira sp.]|nr:Hsp33 family molecular chaperone HslO [Oleispira sp.]MBL4881348.1 Hsp33 family molecular chaperone HslO [Oleispira sp.]